MVQTCSVVVQVPGFDYEEQRRWRQVAVRRKKTVFGPRVRGSVIESVEAEFDPSGGLKKEEKEEEGCAAAVKEVEHVVGSYPAQRKYSTWGLVTSVETEALRHRVC